MASQSVTVTSASPMMMMKNSTVAPPPPPPPMNGTGTGAGVGSGSGGGIGGGVYHRRGGGGNRDRLVREGEINSSSVPKYKTKDESLLASKSDAKLLSAYQCWAALSDKSSAASACKLADGKLKLNIIFDGNLSVLTALGFVAQGTPVRNQIHGSVALDKLVALAIAQRSAIHGPGSMASPLGGILSLTAFRVERGEMPSPCIRRRNKKARTILPRIPSICYRGFLFG